VLDWNFGGDEAANRSRVGWNARKTWSAYLSKTFHTRQGQKRVHRCGDQAVPFRSSGAVALFDVMERIEADSTFLAHTHELLREAILHVNVPAHHQLWSHSDVVDCR